MILLVEDDGICRIDFAQKLRSYGYEVLEATDGAEAIALLENHYPTIDIVITDMVMPKVNGLNLIVNIQTRWPKLPVIMLSAYLSQYAGDSILGQHVHYQETCQAFRSHCSRQRNRTTHDPIIAFFVNWASVRVRSARRVYPIHLKLCTL
jgi:CheY-like chemotaxis protein